MICRHPIKIKDGIYMDKKLTPDEKPLWITPNFSEEDALLKVEKLQKGLRAISVLPIGFPYALFHFSWNFKNLYSNYTEYLFCLVDRCRGVSASLEAAPLTSAPASVFCPAAFFELSDLEKIAKRQAMQVQRGRLRRRHDMQLIDQREILKPLWRIDAELPGYENIALLVDGLSGGYYLLEE